MKNFFLNRAFRPAPFNFILDGILLYIVFAPPLDGSFARNPAAALFWMSASAFWFCWRRTWIQKAIQRYLQNELQVEVTTHQQMAEQEQQRSLVDTTTDSTHLPGSGFSTHLWL